MKLHGKPWTVFDAFRLHNLMVKHLLDAEQAAKILGRSPHAVVLKLQKSGFLDENKRPTSIPTEIQFLRQMHDAHQLTMREISAEYRNNRLSKIFNYKTRIIKGLVSIPHNKKYLVPKMTKWEAREKYASADSWWKFANEAQANPYMRTYLYRSQGKDCELCGNKLTEADFQAHHITYEHACTFQRKIDIHLNRWQKKSVPDCENCHLSSEERFLACATRLCAVHGSCNKILR